MNIPKQFEYLHTYTQFQGLQQAPVFVTVLDVFEHHYTGTKMYHIRLEHDGTFGFKGCDPRPSVDYKTVAEDEMMKMLEERIKEKGIWFTSFPSNNPWVSGENEEGYTFSAKLFNAGGCYGINGGRVTKLQIRDKDRRLVVNYETGWDVRPGTPEHQRVFEEVLDFLEKAPRRWH